MSPKPKVKLIGCNGNAFALLGECKKAAEKENWSTEEWELFEENATSGDYNHLLRTISEHFRVE